MRLFQKRPMKNWDNWVAEVSSWFPSLSIPSSLSTFTIDWIIFGVIFLVWRAYLIIRSLIRVFWVFFFGCSAYVISRLICLSSDMWSPWNLLRIPLPQSVVEAHDFMLSLYWSNKVGGSSFNTESRGKYILFVPPRIFFIYQVWMIWMFLILFSWHKLLRCHLCKMF